MSHVQNAQRKETLRSKVNTATTRLAVIATPVILATSAHAAEDNSIDIGTLGITGLTAAAATIFAVKAGPSMMMWGYRKILGFIGR